MVNAIILDERVDRCVNGDIIDSRIEGRVAIGEGTKVVNSVVRGPAIIGNGCVIENSFIGPYTSIGDEVEIKESSLEYCIILNGALIKGIERLEESLIGKKAMVVRNSGNRRILRLNLGDYSKVEI